MMIRPGTPKEEADRMLDWWHGQFDDVKRRNRESALNWNFEAHGEKGLGLKDLNQMWRQGFSHDDVRAVHEKAKSEGRNVGPGFRDYINTVNQHSSNSSPSVSTASHANPGRPSIPSPQDTGWRRQPVTQSGPRQDGWNQGIGRDWDHGAHGMSGFGGKDFEAMRSRGYSDQHIRNAIGSAREKGLNVGRRVRDWEATGMF